MLARFRPLITGLISFAITGVVIFDYPALAGVPIVF